MYIGVNLFDNSIFEYQGNFNLAYRYTCFFLILR